MLIKILFADIIIQILGIGKCEWNEQRRVCGAEEIYLKKEISIYDAEGLCCEI